MLVLGIDVGKRELFVQLQDASGGWLGQRGPVANTPAGLQQLSHWISTFAPPEQVQVVMEATNVYWERCAHHFQALGCVVSVVNPAQIKYFARSVLRRGKTDAMDAELIARYGVVMHPGRWTPPSRALNDLKQLTRERLPVLVRRTQEHNYLQALQDAHYASETGVKLAQQRLDLVMEQLVEIEAAMHALIHADETLSQQLKLLLSVPGFAFVSAATMLAETVGFAQLETRREISAAAGLAPSPHQSGTKRGRGSISKTGNARLRRIAYLSALGEQGHTAECEPTIAICGIPASQPKWLWSRWDANS
ncbi:IS110 family transposase [Deinococcus sp. QL22]|uniref:IS110 family transposase n=1 Tax=Deinococcus sp. QL22 TaxID=2939437 RepID=UPI00201754DA|nr:IS110 family transposase [Deinococcus sp. QL22]UQN07243.1 IS110 family transposase [Deinococcus sp. QL22]